MKTSSKAARRELPALAIELEDELVTFERIGELGDGEILAVRILREEISQLSFVKLGIPLALSNLQYKISDLQDNFWVYDNHQPPLVRMIIAISEFLESPRYELGK